MKISRVLGEHGTQSSPLVFRGLYSATMAYHSFQYQAKSWQQPRRVVARFEWHAGVQHPI